MGPALERVGEGIFAIDTRLQRPRMVASHLVVDAGRAAFVDVGTSLAAPLLLDALAAAGLAPDAVDYVFLTHIHLDHAGGAGELARLLPRAVVVLHPRAAPHMADPQLLVAATKAVYGEDHFREHYGQIVPVPPARLRIVEEGARITLGSRSFEFLHTPGHALHHVTLFEAASRTLFTGDTFGISYREFDGPNGAFVFATTSPTQFDPAQLHASVDRILALDADQAFLTHYSRVGDLRRLGADLHADIDACVAIATAAAQAPDPAAEIRPRLHAHLGSRLERHGCPLPAAERHALLDGDVILNADGLAAWLARARVRRH
jgi:glyoxylase-like metal-dependent hydrolase (beta-lactamase superfamily II)